MDRHVDGTLISKRRIRRSNAPAAEVKDVIRTRVVLKDIGTWRQAARAHREVLAPLKPACAFTEVSGFIDPAWLVEIEIDCVTI